MHRDGRARRGELLFNQSPGGDFRFGQPARQVADAQSGNLGRHLGANVGNAQDVLSFKQADGAGIELLRGVGDDDSPMVQQFAGRDDARPGGQRMLGGDGEDEIGVGT